MDPITGQVSAADRTAPSGPRPPAAAAERGSPGPSPALQTTDQVHASSLGRRSFAAPVPLVGGQTGPAGSAGGLGPLQVSDFLFRQIDTNGDQRLDAGELDVAVNDPRFHGSEAAAIVAMAQNELAIQNVYGDDLSGPQARGGLSRMDLTMMNIAGPRSPLVQQVTATRDQALARIQGTTRALFAQGMASIRPGTVRQGMIGDCYLVSALASMARSRPETIRDMILDNHDGTYDVTIATPRGQRQIRVSAPTDAEVGRYGTAGVDGYWVTVIEKATAEYVNAERYMPYRNPIQALGNGASINTGVDTLGTQAPIILDIRRMTDDQIASALQRILSLKGAMVAGTYPGNGQTRDGFVQSHAYSITAFDPQTRLITVRNPWGSGGPRNDGYSQITPAQLRANFVLASMNGVNFGARMVREQLRPEGYVIQ